MSSSSAPSSWSQAASLLISSTLDYSAMDRACSYSVGNVMSCHVMSCHVMRCHAMPYFVLSCYIVSCLVDGECLSHITSRKKLAAMHLEPLGCWLRLSRILDIPLLFPSSPLLLSPLISPLSTFSFNLLIIIVSYTSFISLHSLLLSVLFHLTSSHDKMWWCYSLTVRPTSSSSSSTWSSAYQPFLPPLSNLNTQSFYAVLYCAVPRFMWS